VADQPAEHVRKVVITRKEEGQSFGFSLGYTGAWLGSSVLCCVHCISMVQFSHF
jgi:hypothetical protein